MIVSFPSKPIMRSGPIVPLRTSSPGVPLTTFMLILAGPSEPSPKLVLGLGKIEHSAPARPDPTLSQSTSQPALGNGVGVGRCGVSSARKLLGIVIPKPRQRGTSLSPTLNTGQSGSLPDHLQISILLHSAYRSGSSISNCLEHPHLLPSCEQKLEGLQLSTLASAKFDSKFSILVVTVKIPVLLSYFLSQPVDSHVAKPGIWSKPTLIVAILADTAFTICGSFSSILGSIPT